MRILIAKRRDKGVLRCLRDDGTEDWQRQAGRHAPHFVHHDITHFVVETELGLREAFFGLVASGWRIDDTTGLGPRGALPTEALLAERLVGLLDVERATRTAMRARDVVTTLEDGLGPLPASLKAQLTDATLTRIRARRVELSQRWEDLPDGDALPLDFAAEPTIA